MGNSVYSSVNRAAKATKEGYHTLSRQGIFKSRSINNAMNPHGLETRESRDSTEHPESLGIIIGLDVTGSMGSIPHFLAKDGLPDIMEKIIDNGIKDPQVLFLGVGDHEYDQAPLQVGQFESGDDELDHWLTTVYLEGGGGANSGESYLLAWYLAGYHTSMDCWEKREQKGFLFTIGDEPVLPFINKRELKEIMGDGQYNDFSHVELLDKAKETFHVYHLHLTQGSGNNEHTRNDWKQLMGDNLIIVEKKSEIGNIIADIVTKHSEKTSETVESLESSESPEEMML